jgi:hypothetical protein
MSDTKIIFTSDIKFFSISQLTEEIEDAEQVLKRIDYVKDKYQKAIILTSNYKIKNPLDIEGLRNIEKDFDKKIIKVHNILQDNYGKSFLVTGFNSRKNKIQSFESLGIDAIKTLRSLKMYFNDDDNIVTNCGFIFYENE